MAEQEYNRLVMDFVIKEAEAGNNGARAVLREIELETLTTYGLISVMMVFVFTEAHHKNPTAKAITALLEKETGKSGLIPMPENLQIVHDGQQTMATSRKQKKGDLLP